MNSYVPISFQVFFPFFSFRDLEYSSEMFRLSQVEVEWRRFCLALPRYKICTSVKSWP